MMLRDFMRLLPLVLFLLTGCMTGRYFERPENANQVKIYIITGTAEKPTPQVVMLTSEEGSDEKTLELYGKYNEGENPKNPCYIYTWPKEIRRQETYIPSLILIMSSDTQQMYVSVSAVDLGKTKQVKNSKGRFELKPSTEYVITYDIDTQSMFNK